MSEKGHFHRKRQQQQQAWMWSYIQDNIMQLFLKDQHVKDQVGKFERLVEREEMTPSLAAAELLRIFSERKR